ncbi:MULTISPECIES: flagellar hook assembly protein FlgD [unclassified Duganella]|uniref:flagellar hook assembly protein FlgD n=1 Tax=unclassified Duganella TaxID=2636909 RepID=UPI0006F2C967|nr:MULTISPECIES: flagellar hook assembly protein FlgD [unclassified Duganella]KQV54231.1 flagellar biosynthesis protein FlgD [Duganella sp. Root336D2]KRC03358.1 flagellar biosynthesis protein FlgD [Duganella sp. Root198D2]
MAITNTPVTGGSTPTQALLNAVNTRGSTGSDKSVTADQDKFMTLLITQLKNQDPLNPLDNAQVTSQLAQLQTVTGINKLNETIESLKKDYANSASLQATNLINHGVLAAGKNLQLASSKGLFGVEMKNAVDTLQIDIKNASGKVVHSLSLQSVDAGVLPLGWDGKLADGSTAPDGMYSVEVSGTLGGKAAEGLQALTFGTVASVSTGAGGTRLNVPAIGQLTMDDIKQVL